MKILLISFLIATSLTRPAIGNSPESYLVASEAKRPIQMNLASSRIISNEAAKRKMKKKGKGGGESKGKGKSIKNEGKGKRQATSKGKGKGKSKGKSKGKHKKTDNPTAAPTISVRPSQVPSVSPSTRPSLSQLPSFHPSLSSMPTVSPTWVPTSSPSSHPSSTPTSVPSFQPTSHPTISTRPSASPSYKPSSMPTSSPSTTPTISPTSSPTSVPTASPSSSPTVSPSTVPTTNPTSIPSYSPSSTPTISSPPSNNPSYAPSVQPSIFTIEGTREVGDNGIQSGCLVPDGVPDSEFAEETVIRAPVEYLYSLHFKNDGSPETTVEVLASIEKDFQNLVLSYYIRCSDLGRVRLLQNNKRELIDFNPNEPIGVSSLPKDEAASDMACTNQAEGEICLPLDGSLTVLFPTSSSISPSLKGLEVLDVIKNVMNDGTFVPTHPSVTGVDYYGVRDNSNFGSRGGLVNRADAQNEAIVLKSGLISSFGAMLIGAVVFIIVAALVAMNKRMINARFKRDNAGALTSLRCSNSIGRGSYDFSCGELCVDEEEGNLEGTLNKTFDTVHDGEMSSFGSPQRSSPPRRLRGQEGLSISFPIGNAGHISRDVHVCSSATCQECSHPSRDRIRFVKASDGWYDDVEIDFSGNTVFGDDTSLRTYATPNTVQL